MDDLKNKIKASLKEKMEQFQETDLGKKLDEHMEKVSEKLGEKLNNDETLQKIAMGILQRAQKVQESFDETGDIVNGGKELIKRTGKKVLEKIEDKMVPDEEREKK